MKDLLEDLALNAEQQKICEKMYRCYDRLNLAWREGLGFWYAAWRKECLKQAELLIEVSKKA